MKKYLCVLITLFSLGLVACKPQEPSVADAIIEKKEVADKVKAAMDQGAESSRKLLEDQLDQANGLKEKDTQETNQ